MSPIFAKTIISAGALGAFGSIMAVPGLPTWLIVVLSAVGGALGGWAHLPQPGSK